MSISDKDISFHGLYREVITTQASPQLKKNDLCYFSANKTVAPATSSTGFTGKALEIYPDGSACVQIHGYIEVPYLSSAPITGYDLQNLSCENATTVKANANGRPYLVVSLNSAKKIAGIIL